MVTQNDSCVTYVRTIFFSWTISYEFCYNLVFAGRTETLQMKQAIDETRYVELHCNGHWPKHCSCYSNRFVYWFKIKLWNKLRKKNIKLTQRITCSVFDICIVLLTSLTLLSTYHTSRSDKYFYWRNTSINLKIVALSKTFVKKSFPITFGFFAGTTENRLLKHDKSNCISLINGLSISILINIMLIGCGILLCRYFFKHLNVLKNI